MSWRRPKLTIKATMVLVGVLAVASLGARVGLERWRAMRHQSLVLGSSLGATLLEPTTWPPQKSLPEDRVVPVAITYNFRFSAGTPPPGASTLLLAHVWFEDEKTGRAVCGTSFDVALQAGGREFAADTFRWDAVVPGPGRYYLHSRLCDVGPTGDVVMLGGSGTTCEFAPREDPPADRKEAP